MSEVLAPQGYETADSIADNNIMEVYQPDSDGIRRNKQETVDVMKIYFRTMPSYTANRLLMASSTGLPVISSVSQAEVTTAIAQTSTNAGNIGALEDLVGQSLNITDSPTFSSINTGHGSVECYAMNQDVETGDTPTFADVNITGLTGTVESRIEGNASDIDTLEGKVDTLEDNVGQSLNTDDNVTFATVNTGHGSVECYAMNQDVETGDTPTFADINITGLTGTVESRIEGNASDIDTLEGKVGQSLNDDDDVTFGSVETTGDITTKTVDATGNIGTSANIRAGGYVDVDGYGEFNGGRIISGFIHDDSATGAEIYTEINSVMGSNYYIIIASGTIVYNDGGTKTLSVSRIARNSSTSFNVYGCDTSNDEVLTLNITSSATRTYIASVAF